MATVEHSRANVFRVASNCLLWPHRIVVVSRSFFVLRINRVLCFFHQCVEFPVRLNFRRGRMKCIKSRVKGCWRPPKSRWAPLTVKQLALF